MAEQPHWHQIVMLATIARHIDGMVEADQEQLIQPELFSVQQVNAGLALFISQ